MKKVAIVPAQGIGDSLIMHIAAHNFKQAGYEVTTFSNHLQHFGKWLSNYQFALQPPIEEIENLFKSFDLILLQHDNSPKAKKIKTLPNCFTFYGSHIPEKHGPLSSYDYVCNPNHSMVDNLVQALTEWFGFTSKENGLRPPEGLIHQKHSKRIAIHPDGSSSEKKWSLSKFQKLSTRLTKEGYDPIFLTLENKPLCRTLETLASFLYESGGFIGNDSGPGHLASYLQIPSLIIGESAKHFRLWRPGWLPAKIATPSRWVSYFKFTRKRWKSFLSVNKTYLLLNKK
jgi:heptosyltransferase-3